VDEAIVLWEQCVAVFRDSGNRVRTARSSLTLPSPFISPDRRSAPRRCSKNRRGWRIRSGKSGQKATSLTYLGSSRLNVAGQTARRRVCARRAALAPRVSDAWVTVHLLEIAACWLGR